MDGLRRREMLTYEKLQDLIRKYDVPYNHNIVPGHTKTKIKWILPAGIINAAAFERAESFFLYFAEDRIAIFPVTGDWEGGEPLELTWDEIQEFNVNKGFLAENEMHLKAGKLDLELKISKRVVNNPWVKENNIFLESVNYYCK